MLVLMTHRQLRDRDEGEEIPVQSWLGSVQDRR